MILMRVVAAPLIIGALALMAHENGVTGLRLAMGTAVVGTIVYTLIDMRLPTRRAKDSAWLRWTITSNLIVSSFVGAMYALLFRP